MSRGITAWLRRAKETGPLNTLTTRKRAVLKGEYCNVNTPVELYPYGARYLDLEVDVIRRPGEAPFIVDREELAILAKDGLVGPGLEKKALQVAEGLLKRMC